MATELKPCPFCGGEAEAFEDDGNFGVHCKNYNCIGYDIEPQYIEDGYAIEAWNRRAEDADLHLSD